MLNLKPWDLERMSTESVQMRLEWIKAWQAERQRQNSEIDQLNSENPGR